MKRLKMKKTIASLFIILFSVFTIFGTAQINDHDKYIISDLERMEDENMDYLNHIYKIVKNYPAFSYSYNIEDNEIQDVVVKGVDSNLDRKRLEVILFDLKTNKNRMKNKANRIGVFYSVDKEAEYENGWEGLRKNILSNLEYPSDIKNWGLEGTVFVKFVVDENGEIPFLTTSTNMESTMDIYVDRLEEEAAEAIKTTSGEWESSEVEGVEVASLVVVPITFDVEKNPSIPVMIR
jgi:hypothetical protein